MSLPDYKQPEIHFDEKFKENFSEMDVFLKLFPKSLIMWISSCTNERLKMFGESRVIPKEITPTDYHEIMLVLAVTLQCRLTVYLT